MPSSDRVLVQFRCKPWVRQALRRGAFESGKSLSRFIADFLEGCCQGEAEDPPYRPTNLWTRPLIRPEPVRRQQRRTVLIDPADWRPASTSGPSCRRYARSGRIMMDPRYSAVVRRLACRHKRSQLAPGRREGRHSF
jgi:hypothetical protein